MSCSSRVRADTQALIRGLRSQIEEFEFKIWLNNLRDFTSDRGVGLLGLNKTEIALVGEFEGSYFMFTYWRPPFSEINFLLQWSKDPAARVKLAQQCQKYIVQRSQNCEWLERLTGALEPGANLEQVFLEVVREIETQRGPEAVYKRGSRPRSLQGGGQADRGMLLVSSAEAGRE